VYNTRFKLAELTLFGASFCQNRYVLTKNICITCNTNFAGARK